MKHTDKLYLIKSAANALTRFVNAHNRFPVGVENAVNKQYSALDLAINTVRPESVQALHEYNNRLGVGISSFAKSLNRPVFSRTTPGVDNSNFNDSFEKYKTVLHGDTTNIFQQFRSRIAEQPNPAYIDYINRPIDFSTPSSALVAAPPAKTIPATNIDFDINVSDPKHQFNSYLNFGTDFLYKRHPNIPREQIYKLLETEFVRAMIPKGRSPFYNKGEFSSNLMEKLRPHAIQEKLLQFRAENRNVKPKPIGISPLIAEHKRKMKRYTDFTNITPDELKRLEELLVGESIQVNPNLTGLYRLKTKDLRNAMQTPFVGDTRFAEGKITDPDRMPTYNEGHTTLATEASILEQIKSIRDGNRAAIHNQQYEHNNSPFYETVINNTLQPITKVPKHELFLPRNEPDHFTLSREKLLELNNPMRSLWKGVVYNNLDSLLSKKNNPIFYSGHASVPLGNPSYLDNSSSPYWRSSRTMAKEELLKSINAGDTPDLKSVDQFGKKIISEVYWNKIRGNEGGRALDDNISKITQKLKDEATDVRTELSSPQKTADEKARLQQRLDVINKTQTLLSTWRRSERADTSNAPWYNEYVRDLDLSKYDLNELAKRDAIIANKLRIFELTKPKNISEFIYHK